MNWQKTSETLPENGIEVLVIDNGTCHLAHYDADEKAYRLREGRWLYNTREVRWTYIPPPPKLG